jgi:4-hydroxy-tetrahydrodipicolinate reductase
MTQIAVLGAAGRMGRAILRCAAQHQGLRIVAAIEQPSRPEVGQDAGTVAGIAPLGVTVASDIAAVEKADVLIDFTFHSEVPANAALAARLGKGLVVGTTGLSEAEIAAIRQAAATVPVVFSPNMSLGVNLLFALVRKAAQTLGPAYDIEVVEMHHRLKKDAPSGTALALAQKAAEGRGLSLPAVACNGRAGITGERPRDQIGIHALRGGDVVGDHTVVFAAEGERVELSHKAGSRDSFAHGALRAAAWLQGKPPKLYDMQDVLGLA